MFETKGFRVIQPCLCGNFDIDNCLKKWTIDRQRSRCFGIMRGHDLFFERWTHCLISATKVPDMRTYQNEFPAMSEYSSIAN
jgi:hypothetical protein